MTNQPTLHGAGLAQELNNQSRRRSRFQAAPVLALGLALMLAMAGPWGCDSPDDDALLTNPSTATPDPDHWEPVQREDPETPNTGEQAALLEQLPDPFDSTSEVDKAALQEIQGTDTPYYPISWTSDGWQSPPLTSPAALSTSAFTDMGFPYRLPRKPDLSPATTTPWLSSGPIAVLGSKLLAVDRPNGNLVVTHRVTGQRLQTVHVGGNPEHLVVSPTGATCVSRPMLATAWCANVSPKEDEQVNPGGTWEVDTGYGVRGMAMTPGGQAVIFGGRANNTLTWLDLATRATTTVPLPTGMKGPSALAFNDDGVLAVTLRGEHIITMPTNADGVPDTSLVQSVDLRVEQPWDEALSPQRPARVVANRALGVTTDPATGDFLVTHVQTLQGDTQTAVEAAKLAYNGTPPQYYAVPVDFPNPGMPGSDYHNAPAERPIETSVTRVTGATPQGNTQAGPIVPGMPSRDPQSLRPAHTVTDQPVHITHHPALSVAVVTTLGTDNLMVINTASPDPMSDVLGLVDVCMAPRGSAFSEDGAMLYVVCEASYAIAEVPMSWLLNSKANDEASVGPGLQPTNIGQPDTMSVANPALSRVTKLGDPAADPTVELGRRVFHFAQNPRVSADAVFACASCHTEGAQDDLTWYFVEGARQTPALFGRVPGLGGLGWLGKNADLASHAADSVKRMAGLGLTEEDLFGLVAFLEQTERHPSPHLGTELTQAQERGRLIYESPDVGCASCHSEAGTNHGNYDVGTMDEAFAAVVAYLESLEWVVVLPTYNVPSLIGLWDTAPYLHDGSAKTLHNVLAHTMGTMGDATKLSAAELDDLVAYLLTL